METEESPSRCEGIGVMVSVSGKLERKPWDESDAKKCITDKVCLGERRLRGQSALIAPVK